MDYDVERFSRHCARSGRELQPGETYYSVLVPAGAELKRLDFAAEAWEGPPAEAVGWWKAVLPDRAAARKHWAPNDVMLQLFDELAEQPEREDMRYLLTLLLVRRRVMRLEETQRGAPGREVLVVFCPRRDASYEVVVATPTPERMAALQSELEQLLQ